MVNVRMLWDMQGGRHDGQPWPGYLKEIDVPDWEAAELISSGTAELADTPALDRGFDVLRVADPDYESGLKFADGGVIENDPGEYGDAVPAFLDNSTVLPANDFDSDFEDSDEDNEAEGLTPQVKRPSTVDNKAAWIEYAVSKGADREKAAAKTKAMLIADY